MGRQLRMHFKKLNRQQALEQLDRLKSVLLALACQAALQFLRDHGRTLPDGRPCSRMTAVVQFMIDRNL